ncbi:AGE family epimerase/isomerase [Paraburkholderia nemoris]|uniref:AGE family epimerase/isomerase n=1 Tax=Paraburkholderia nemoris TaxID=2793076 RepID=UPI0038B7B274
MEAENRSVTSPVEFLIGSAMRHYVTTVLPMWRSSGFNPDLELPFEAVSSVDCQPLPALRYRAMACARQLFVFSRAGELDHAAKLFESLLRNFRDKTRGGWYFSIGPDCTPLDTTKDLYTHAFVVFACSEYLLRSGVGEAEQVVRETTSLIEDRFSADVGGGLLNGALDRDFNRVLMPPVQNPIMHLAEAYLAASAAIGDASFEELLQRIGRVVENTFLDRSTGCILELPRDSAGNRIEPGHQFEWFYLVRSGSFDWAGEQLDESISRAFGFAQRNGIDPATNGVCAALNLDGSVQDHTQRIWAQTEYLRALAMNVDSDSNRMLAEQIFHFSSRFLSEKGWNECLSPNGQIVRSDMPSTTPYHLCTAYSELQRIV